MRIIAVKDVDPEVISKMSAVKVSLLTTDKFTFFSAALMRLNISYATCKTLATDGVNLFINPNFILPLSNRQIAFGLLHEVFHVIYEHIHRKGSRDHHVWNLATDYVINNQLDNMGLDVIDGICLDHKYDGMSADQVYAILIKDPNSKNQSPSFDDMIQPHPDGTDDSNGNPLPNMTPDQVSQHVKDIVDASIMAAEMAGETGSIPAEIMRNYKERMNPKIDWKSALSDFLFVAGKQGSSYKKPSRRGRALGITLPGKLGKGLGRIDFSIDTSGSVSQDMFTQFISEISYVFEKLKPKSIGVSQFDHELKSRDVIEKYQDFKDIKFVGGGGTEIHPVMEMFKQVDSKALIVLTDGYFNHNPSMNPGKPVVWCIYGNPNWKPPFGTAIHFNL